MIPTDPCTAPAPPRTWSIQEVAAVSRLTPRTLRHYDAIGLLPAERGANGYRRYTARHLVRLQRVLVLRELGLGLDAIAELIAGTTDEVTALRDHHRRLLEERRRLTRLATAVLRTVGRLEGGHDMAPEEMFGGFAERRAHLEATLVQRHGDGVRRHFAQSEARTRDWTREDFEQARAEGDTLDARMAELLVAGAPVDDPRVGAVVRDHLASVSRFWTPDRASYTELGRLYADDPGFREHYDALQPGLAEFLRDAIAGYAALNMP